MHKPSLIKGGLFALFAVILGAFGAHALKALLSPEQLESFNTAVRYLMYHGFALLILGVISEKIKHQWLRVSSQLIFLGTLLFSGSILLLVCRNLLNMDFLKVLGPITPLGGTILIIGWILFILTIVKEKQI